MKQFISKNKLSISIIFIAAFVYSISILNVSSFIFYDKVKINLNAKIENADNIKLFYSEDKNKRGNNNVTLPVKYESKTERKSVLLQNIYEKNPNSKGTEVWIFKVKVDGKELPWDKVKLEGNWEFRDDIRGVNGKVLLSYRKGEDKLPSSLRIDIPKAQFVEFEFLKHDYSGKLIINQNNKVENIDLYESSSLTYTHKLSDRIPGFFDYEFEIPAKKISSLKLIADRDSAKIHIWRISGISGSIRGNTQNEIQFLLDKDINTYKGNSFLYKQIIISVFFTMILFSFIWYSYARIHTKFMGEHLLEEILRKTAKFYLVFFLLFLTFLESGEFFTPIFLTTIFSFFVCYGVLFFSVLKRVYSSQRYGPIFICILLGGILLRVLFILYYPYPFGYGDTVTYIPTAVDLLEKLRYTIDPYRTPGYGLFTYLILKLIYPKFIFIVIIQHLLGVSTALLVYLMILKQTESKLLSSFAFCIVMFLPRMIFYEHTLLTDSLTSFIIVFFFYLIQRGKFLFCSFVIFFLVLLRPENLYSVIIAGVIGLILLLKSHKINIKEIINNTIKVVLPCSLLICIFVFFNYTSNGHVGLTKYGSGVILHMLTAYITDFDSDLYKEEKRSFEKIVEESNGRFGGDNWWRIPDIYKSRKLLAESTDPILLDNISKEIAIEAIKAHPFAYLFHAISEFKRMMTLTVPPTDDMGAYLRYIPDNSTFYIVGLEDVEAVNRVTVSEEYLKIYVHGKYIDSIALKINSLLSFNLFNYLYTFVPSTFHGVVWTPLFLLVIGVVIFLRKAIPYYRWLFLFMVCLFILIKVSIHASLAWSYERYFLHVEPLVIMCSLLGLYYIFSLKNKKDFHLLYQYIISIFVSIIIKYLVLSKFVIFWGYDSPIRGMSHENVIFIENFVWQNLLLVVSFMVSMFLLRIFFNRIIKH